MGSRWGPDGPPPEAFSRVTDEQRYAPLAQVVDRVVADLVRRFDVAVTEEPVDGTAGRSAVRVRPRSGGGADLVVERTGSGVRLRAGRWTEASFPSCGCDACDEDVDDVAEELREYVADVVTGRLQEELTRGLRRSVLSWRRPTSSGGHWLTRTEARELGPPGRHVWAAWPARRGG
jgi:hypothetical protein